MSRFWQHQRPRSTLTGLPTLAEGPEDNQTLAKGPEDVQTVIEDDPLNLFEHSQSLALGEATFIVFEKTTGLPHILQSCKKENWTAGRSILADIARTSNFLVCTENYFESAGRVYMVSQIADMSLADIIPCSISLSDAHISAILKQVGKHYS